MGVQKSRRVPPFCFSALWDFFFEKLFFLQRVPLHLRQKCWQFRKCPPFSAPGARVSGPRHATRSTFFGFSIFEYCKLTLEPVPACCHVTNNSLIQNCLQVSVALIASFTTFKIRSLNFRISNYWLFWSYQTRATRSWFFPKLLDTKIDWLSKYFEWIFH